jgi:hypothetical protein
MTTPTCRKHPEGDYRFLPGIAPYSCGVAAAPGFEIVHATFQTPPPYREGFDRVAAHLQAAGRPRAALCGIELRSPRPFTFPGFAAFNREYAAILQDWGLFVDGINPVARTNVAPAVEPPPEPVLYGFSYTAPCASGTHDGSTFVVAGAGELPEGVLDAGGIVAAGDTSPAGIARKAEFVMGLMEARLRGLGGDWHHVTAIDVYTIHPFDGLLPTTILGRAGASAAHGIRWFYSRPPVEGIEFEMDLRGVRSEIRVE